MSFIKCPECGTQYSDTQKQCPYCGCPTNMRMSEATNGQPARRQQRARQKEGGGSGCAAYVVFLCVLLMLVVGGVGYLLFKREYDNQRLIQQQKERLEKIRQDSLAEVRRAQEQSVRDYQEQEEKRQLLMSEIEKMVKNWVNTGVWHHASANLRHYDSACVRNYDFDNYSEEPLFDADAFYGVEDGFTSGNYVQSAYCSQYDGDKAVVNVKFCIGDASENRLLYLEKNGLEWELVDFKNPMTGGTFLEVIKAEIRDREAEGYEVFYNE